MDAKDWYDCGARIGDLVQRAIDSQDFGSLNDAIMRTIGQSIDAAADGLQQAADPGRSRQKRRLEQMERRGGFYRSEGNAYRKAREEAAVEDVLDSVRKGSQRSPQIEGINRSPKGIFSMVAGYGMAALMGLGALAFLLGSVITGLPGFRFTSVVFMILTAVFALVGAKGGEYRSRLKQLEQYLKIMDGRDVVTIQELASGTGQSVTQVRKDLKSMIKDGMFATEAYLDPKGQNLMTSREAYRQYQETMKAYEQRKAAAQQEKKQESAGAVRLSDAQRKAAEQDLATYSDETRTMLQEGRDFIAHIHQCNEDIPEEDMTAKLDRLEQVVARIFDQVAAKPDSAPDLHRMMSYYLPVTRKLVDAYVDLRSTNIQGENVTNTRREIETSLDTINLAFETFLDSFYQDTAWDISSDISAMKTMMARDGLTGGGAFGRVKKVGSELGKGAALSAGGGAAAALQEEEET